MKLADSSLARPDLDITTNVAVRYDADNATDNPEEAALTLSIAYRASSSLATLRLSQKIALLERRVKSPFYIFLPTEHIRQIRRVGTAPHTTCGNAYQLRVVLGRPPELIGPPWAWKGRDSQDEEQLRKLQAVAGAMEFTLFIPTRALGVDDITRLCEAAATGTLQSDPTLLRLDSLYSGKGGRKYELPRAGVVSPPAYTHDTSASKPGEDLPAYHPHATSASPDGPARTPPAAAETSRTKRRRGSSSGDSGVGGHRKMPCIGSSPLSADQKRRLLRLHARLDALHARLSSDAVDSTLNIRSQIKQMYEHLREWLDVSEAEATDELEPLQDTVLELQSMVESLRDELGDVNMRIADLDGACSLEAMESMETLQEWVKDYVEESVGELLDDAIARAFRNDVGHVQAAMALLHNLPQYVTMAAGHLPEADDAPRPPPSVVDLPPSDATTVSDTATLARPPAAADNDDDDDDKHQPVPWAERQTMALDSIASASHRIAAALERIAQACEVSSRTAGAAADKKEESWRTSPALSLVFKFHREEGDLS